MSGSQTPAYVRTGTPIGAGAIIVFIAKQLGVDLSVDQALLLMPAVMYAYYVLGRALEHLNPKWGYILGVAKTPAYSTEPAPSPAKGEEVVAEVVPEPEVDPQPVDEPVEEPFVEEPIQPLIRSTPLDEVRATARKRSPRKAQPPS